MENISLTMVREDMENIPQYPLPVGYQIRLYRSGDKDTWAMIQRIADSRPDAGEIFEGAFGADVSALDRRCFFLVSPDGRDVGTVAAWYERKYLGRRWGLIHWLAILPEHQGRGLSKPMLTVAMNRLCGLGHRRALLRTATHRIPALKVYLDFGFVPDMTRKDAERGWKMVREAIDHPALSGV